MNKTKKLSMSLMESGKWHIKLDISNINNDIISEFPNYESSYLDIDGKIVIVEKKKKIPGLKKPKKTSKKKNRKLDSFLH